MNRSKIVFVIIIILITIMFFSYDIIIAFDSSHYNWLANMFTKNESFRNWDIARGPVFPLIIFITNLVFGYTSKAFLIVMYLAYITMLLVCYKIYTNVTNNGQGLSGKYKITQIILFLVLVAINPIVFGYFHALLTEFVSIPFAMLMSYIAWKWIDKDFTKNNRKGYIVYSIIFMLASAFAWNLKQPYVTLAIVPIFSATLISIIKNRSKVNITSKVLTSIACVVSIVFSMFVWKGILLYNNVYMNMERTSSGFFSKMIVEGISNYTREFDESEYKRASIEKNENISNEDKATIYNILDGKSNKYSSFLILKQVGGEDKILFLKDTELSTKDAIEFAAKTFITRPFFIIDGYIANYLSTINVYKTVFELNTGKISVVRDIDLFSTCENGEIAYRIFNTGTSNTFPTNEKYKVLIDTYGKTIETVRPFNFIMVNLEGFSNLVFKVSLLSLPLLLILSFKNLSRNRNKYKENYYKIYELLVILYSFAFIHILCHSFMGANIDRYAVSAYVATMVGLLVNVYVYIYRKKFVLVKSLKGE